MLGPNLVLPFLPLARVCSFFCGYGAFILWTYVYTHYILHTYVHNVREPLIFGFLKGDQIKGILMQIFVPSIVGWGIALIIS